MSKIAPVLTEVIEKVWRFDPERRFDVVAVEQARRELRSLIAVARAAEREFEGWNPCTPSGLQCGHSMCGLLSALARLRSHGRSQGRERKGARS